MIAPPVIHLIKRRTTTADQQVTTPPRQLAPERHCSIRVKNSQRVSSKRLCALPGQQYTRRLSTGCITLFWSAKKDCAATAAQGTARIITVLDQSVDALQTQRGHGQRSLVSGGKKEPCRSVSWCVATAPGTLQTSWRRRMSARLRKRSRRQTPLAESSGRSTTGASEPTVGIVSLGAASASDYRGTYGTPIASWCRTSSQETRSSSLGLVVARSPRAVQ